MELRLTKLYWCVEPAVPNYVRIHLKSHFIKSVPLWNRMSFHPLSWFFPVRIALTLLHRTSAQYCRHPTAKLGTPLGRQSILSCLYELMLSICYREGRSVACVSPSWKHCLRWIGTVLLRLQRFCAQTMVDCYSPHIFTDKTENWLPCDKSTFCTAYFVWNRKISRDFNEVQLAVYDRERTICDCFKYRTKLNNEMFNKALNAYTVDKNKNLSNLSKYTKKKWGFIKNWWM